MMHCIVIGTRPEIVKVAGIRRVLGKESFLVFTGQHFDANMASSFYDLIGKPDVDFSDGTSRRLGDMVNDVSTVLSRGSFESVIVQGDTNSALAGGLAGSASGVPVVHVEAGLRSFDARMPEERNRILLDHLSALLAAPTPTAVANVLREGVSPDKVVMTGNTIVEAARDAVGAAAESDRLSLALGVPAGGFVLATIHRAENTVGVDDLRAILDQLQDLSVPVVFPVHPRTRQLMDQAGGTGAWDNVICTDPVGRTAFLALLHAAGAVVTDSGGVQEEAVILGKYVVVVRESTERPEALGYGAVLASAESIATTAEAMLAMTPLSGGELVFGDGLASHRIASLVRARFFHRGGEISG